MTSMNAIVFDLDGTLLNTLEDIADAMNEALALMKLPGHPLEAYRNFVGDGMEMLARRVLGDPDPESLNRCITLMRQCYGAGWNRKTQPYPGVIDLLDQLPAGGVVLSVLSNKPHESTVKCVAEFLGLERFARVVGVSEETPKKPDTTGLERILSELALDRERVLYVGDTNTDMKTAVKAGLFPVGVSWGFRPRSELEASGAREIIDHPRQLLDLL